MTEHCKCEAKKKLKRKLNEVYNVFLLLLFLYNMVEMSTSGIIILSKGRYIHRLLVVLSKTFSSKLTYLCPI